MIHVRASEVGDLAYARLVREGLLGDALGPVALPRDVQPNAALRRLALAPFVPSHTWATGLAALWVWGHCPAPETVDLVGARGLHRIVPRTPTPTVVFHSGPAFGLPPGSEPRLASPARACIDALRYGPVGPAIGAVVAARRAGTVRADELVRCARGVDAHTPRQEAIVRLATLIASL